MFDREKFRSDFDKRFKQAQDDFDRTEKQVEKIQQIALCFSAVFSMLLFLLMIAGIFWLVSNA